MQPDRITRSDAMTNANSYHTAIAKLSSSITSAASDSASTQVRGPDPWGTAAGVAGSVLGAVIGGGADGIGAGAAGTLVAPGVGTVAGAGVGGAEGMMLGGAAGAAIGYTIGTTAHDLATIMSGSSPRIAENAAMRPSAPTFRAPEIPSGSIDESKLLDTAQKWLGEGAKEVKPRRWVSQDGLRQFRFGSHETKNPENIHAHFEVYDRPATDGGRLTENAVVKVESNK
jgi:hypothetical protein